MVIVGSPVSSADRGLPPLANTTPVWKRAWIAVAVAEEVPDNTPVQVLVAGEAWVVIRMDGTLTAFEDVCPHRQFPLSAGEVTRAPDGTPRLTCAFHGWRFDAVGECDLKPTDGGGIFGRHRHGGGPGHRGWHGRGGSHGGHHDKHSSLRPAYGITERYGLIWLAAREPLAPLPEFPEWAGDVAGRARVRTVSTPASAGQVIDGFLGAGRLGAAEVATDGWRVAGVFEKHHRITKTAGPHGTAHVRVELPHATVGILLSCQPEDLRTTRVYALGLRVGAARALEAEDLAAVERDLADMERSPSAALPLDLQASGTPLGTAWRKLMARALRA